jgi:hypothetical protein
LIVGSWFASGFSGLDPEGQIMSRVPLSSDAPAPVDAALLLTLATGQLRAPPGASGQTGGNAPSPRRDEHGRG